MLSGVGAYLIWGIGPIFFGLLDRAGSLEVLAHRMLWTVVLMLALLMVLGRLGSLRGMGARTWGLVAVATFAIALNWGVYIYAIASGQVVEAALGYFINPLVSVLLGVVLFRERLRPVQIVPLVLAAVAVAVITIDYGHPPYLSLVLALSFASYGAIKKVIPLDPRTSLTAEGVVAAPFAIAYLIVLAVAGTGSFFGTGVGHSLLLLAAGPFTALPMLLFGIAAQRIPLTTLGVLQYLNPAMQMVWGVVVMHEVVPPSRWVGFILIWVALVVFTTDAVVRARREHSDRPRHAKTVGARA
ncbi:EamA family transporter RarD [Rhodococcus xishaensis]|uniref:EamA family transporter RarD n=1 Tax=Rhodococcus xishaensis TaxID=2487364 RepID=A0A438B3Z0_9NOCA|nr:EamA family transporter RarD [Rhodococcus xishaensis]RVW05662.1 EamA family transporter RarD [Rhodococcus xishaensis]